MPTKNDYLNHPDFNIYMENQRAETGGAGVDHKYLDYLFKVLLPRYRAEIHLILDVGAGSFKSYDYFRNFTTPEGYRPSVIGIEIAKEALDIAKEKHLPLYDIDAHLMDEHFEHRSFDLLISLHSLEHMLDMPLVLDNCYKLLRHGGYFFFALPIPVAQLAPHEGHWYPCDTQEEMLDMVERANFEIVHSFMSEDCQFRAGSEFVCLAKKEHY